MVGTIKGYEKQLTKLRNSAILSGVMVTVIGPALQSRKINLYSEHKSKQKF